LQTIREQMKSLLSQGLDVILPPRCVITGEMVERQGMIAASAWSQLDFVNDPMCEKCGFPFEFESGDGTHCTSCLTFPPPYEQARMPLKYNDTSRSMILGFKHGDQTHAVKAFTPWLVRAAAPFLEQTDMVVPVPLHRWRLLSRRYNQSALMAREFCRHTGKALLVDGLMRTRSTPPQSHLSAKERHKNVRRAFEVNPARMKAVQGKNVILMDDVYTTGATIKECAAALLKAGAGKVFVLTLARVVRDESLI